MRAAGMGDGFLLRGCLCEKAGMSGLLPYGTPSISRVVPTFLHSCPFPAGYESKVTALFFLGGGSSSLNRRGNPRPRRPFCVTLIPSWCEAIQRLPSASQQRPR